MTGTKDAADDVWGRLQCEGTAEKTPGRSLDLVADSDRCSVQ